MFEWLHNTGDSIAWLANILGVLQVVGVIWAIVAFLRARGEYRRRNKMLQVKPADGSVAISIGVGTHIAASVQGFLESHFGIVEGKARIPLVVSYDKTGHLPPADFLMVLHEIRRDIDELRKKSDIREVHLFYGGPYALAAGIGALLDNWVPVQVYMWENKGYVRAFTLSAETIKGD